MTSKNKANLLYLDDIQVGQCFISNSYTLDTEQVKTFAKQFDPQPFHLDEEAAKNTLFGQLIASGWHTAAITMKLLVEAVGYRFAGGLIGKRGELSWPNPTYPSDCLHIEGEVLEIKPSKTRPQWGTVKICNHTINQKQQIVQILIADVMVMRSTNTI
ncbi:MULTISPECIES: MaoC family dehydratase [Legionella]|uniref:Bifunctional aldehyde dehydrogenase/enoyl-CoA hydratase n=1 Tax=Legionella drozanskii LLAP-1 TaxID=1212489 RepID=A0A0W0SVQ5_9GAMM|nr:MULTISPECIES: MaoC family dehydratase [Legionella]KTC87364.1 bifunctional aldehyde dehydrogenase/enoyl-CoA hydratase [Legionella drozanskii LLAP-1]PJE08426.1 MAG: dehydratase [Legionella sp.]